VEWLFSTDKANAIFFDAVNYSPKSVSVEIEKAHDGINKVKLELVVGE